MTQKTSKFAGILRSHKEKDNGLQATPEQVGQPVENEPSNQEQTSTDEEGKPSTKTTVVPKGRAGESATKRAPGRPKANGKRLNPDYTQLTAYIPTKLHRETKLNLITSGKDEFSVLVEELLTEWNKRQTSRKSS